jgi:hypothetical protein
MGTSNVFEQASSFSELRQLGNFTTFVEMHEIFNRLTDVFSSNGPQQLLSNMAECGVKPAFSSDGYSTVALDRPNIESPPRPFTFANSGFVDRPSKSTDVNFFPLVRRDSLPLYFAHEIRWFKHPIRSNVMIPLRMRSHFLGVLHPTSRIYVDMPVVFEANLNSVNFIRVSLNVFEEIIFAQPDNARNFVKLVRTRNGSAVRTRAQLSSVPTDVDRLWELHDSDYMNYYTRNKEFVIEDKPEYWSSAMAVADHLISRCS